MGLTDPSLPHVTSLESQTSASGDPQLEIYSAPRRVHLSRQGAREGAGSEAGKRLEEEEEGKEGMTVLDMACGLDHTLLLVERTSARNTAEREQELWVTGSKWSAWVFHVGSSILSALHRYASDSFPSTLLLFPTSLCLRFSQY